MTDQTEGVASVEADISVAQPEAPAAATEAPQEQVEPAAGDQQKEAEPQEADEAKKLKNALHREKRRIAQLTAQKYQYQSELEALRQKYEGNKPDNTSKSTGSPTADQFDTYEDYQRAVARHEAQEAFKELEARRNEQTKVAEKNEWVSERETLVEDKGKELAKAIPDFVQTLTQYKDVLDYIDAQLPELGEVFLEADNAPLAFYALAKEGKLESVLEMSPRRAAMEVAKAEERGAAYLKQPKPVSKAPEPMSPVKGVSKGEKTEVEMSGDELMRKYGFRK